MKTRLTRISPGDTARILAVITLIGSIVAAILVLVVAHSSPPGLNWELTGFMTLKFAGMPPPPWVLFVYPIGNAVGAMIIGFLTAWLYNAVARRFGGISIELKD